MVCRPCQFDDHDHCVAMPILVGTVDDKRPKWIDGQHRTRCDCQHMSRFPRQPVELGIIIRTGTVVAQVADKWKHLFRYPSERGDRMSGAADGGDQT